MSHPTAAWCPMPCTLHHACQTVHPAMHPTQHVASCCRLTRHGGTAGFAAHQDSLGETAGLGGGALPACSGLGVCPTRLLYIGQPHAGGALNGAGSVLSTQCVIRGYFWGQQLQAFVTFGPCMLTPRNRAWGSSRSWCWYWETLKRGSRVRYVCMGHRTGFWSHMGQGNEGRGLLSGAAGWPSHQGRVGLWELPWGGPWV